MFDLSHWRPSATLSSLQQRAQVIQQIRQFFSDRDYLEVETPCMSQFGITDVYLSNIKARFRNSSYCLQTSPEYHMKRLLAAGSGPIFQIMKVFRDDELGRFHNPEFSLLEWYKLDVDHHALMAEVDELLQLLLACKPAERLTYREIFCELCHFDPFTAHLDEIKSSLENYHLDYVIPSEEQDRDQYLFLLMSHIIEPALAERDRPVVIYNFPASQAALAEINQEGYGERFEFYFKGMELANGFHELRDAHAQEERFQQDLNQRKRLNLEVPALDYYFLDALKHGLPPCSGVALGIDRLMMLALNKEHIADVLSFDFSRA